ncbi:hypothetical protein WICMUC_000077 [Wickerhamomyces mucosus]|uniref:Sas10 C-terminal domain-containing protein n=1 Tax=Wickerhamomyces mucosus TaxID=1378264 RepID=A0A9P8Q152_9ASCO|nr:hypothetical protein WICMUC_000077 [Wickerhamomyces mucosus]
MGKRSRKTNQSTEQDFGLNEVDAFHADRDKILLDQTISRSSKSKYNNNDDDDDSNEEVLNIDEEIDEDSESEHQYNGPSIDQDEEDAEYFRKGDQDDEDDEENEGAWGDRKSTYYGADDLQDEESAKQIEEEALRQQKKHLQELNIDDYVDEELDEEWSKNAKIHDFGESDKSIKDDLKTQSLQDITNLDINARSKFLSSLHPEYIPLSKELTKLSPILNDLKIHQNDNEVSNVKFLALSSYLSAITSYFAIFLTFAKDDEPFSMKEHPVMESILSTKEVWRQANELLDIEETEGNDNDDNDDNEIENETQGFDREESLEAGEVSNEDDFDSAEENIEDEEDENEEDEEDEEEESDIEIDISKPRVFKKSKPSLIEDFAEGEIHDVDAEEKRARKKTLRFYTSKIDQQSKKKDERYTGDLDIPYKERLFERQQRLIEEARKRGLKDDNGVDLDNEDDDDDNESRKRAREINDEFDQSYYDTIKTSNTDKKLKRKEAHDSAIKAAKEGKLAELQENIGEDGKRAINYQILKNKGLTPHRKKENRNSRVKKRLKYEKAQKKLKSVRSVYSAPSSGAYEGEKTGIKKNLSKSIKL